MKVCREDLKLGIISIKFKKCLVLCLPELNLKINDKGIIIFLTLLIQNFHNKIFHFLNF